MMRVRTTVLPDRGRWLVDRTAGEVDMADILMFAGL
jgi:ribosomal protein S28E/S33